MFGVAGFYASFVLIWMLSPGSTTTDVAVSRIQQNTFAVIIYVTISTFLFPTRPINALRRQRGLTFQSISKAMTALVGMFLCNDECGDGESGPQTQCPHMVAYFEAIKTVHANLAVEKFLMPFAEIEPSMTSKLSFPMFPSRELHSVEKKMVALFETMYSAWQLMHTESGEGMSPALLNVVQCGEPIASDISAVCRAVINMLTVSLLDRHASLGSEMVSKVVELNKLAHDLQFRMCSTMLGVVRQSREKILTNSMLERARNEPTCGDDENYHDHLAAYPRNAPLPISSPEMEAVHTISLCLVMFSSELRRLLMTVEELQQFELLE